MRPNWRKRLDRVAASMTPHTPGVVFCSLEGESIYELEQRVARWTAGEMVEGMDREYTGRESSVWIVQSVTPPKRDGKFNE